MLYNKDKKSAVKRSYEYLHTNDATSRVKKRRKSGTSTLSSRPKK